MFKHWKTTLAGAGLLLVAVGQVLGAVASGDFSGIDLKVLAEGLAGLGFIAAADGQ